MGMAATVREITDGAPGLRRPVARHRVLTVAVTADPAGRPVAEAHWVGGDYRRVEAAEIEAADVHEALVDRPGVLLAMTAVLTRDARASSGGPAVVSVRTWPDPFDGAARQCRICGAADPERGWWAEDLCIACGQRLEEAAEDTDGR